MEPVLPGKGKLSIFNWQNQYLILGIHIVIILNHFVHMNCLWTNTKSTNGALVFMFSSSERQHSHNTNHTAFFFL